MNILLINQPLSNRGDEAAHKALVRTLIKQYPNSFIRVFYVDCYSPWSMQQFDVQNKNVSYIDIHSTKWYNKVNEIVLRKHFWRKLLWPIHPTTRQILQHYKWADLILCAPGGINMGGFQDWRHLFFLEMAKYCKKPLAYFGRSVGPFPIDTKINQRFKKLSYDVLKYCSYISLRDKESESYLQSTEIKYFSTVDSAFLEEPHIIIPYEVRMLMGNAPYVVFVPNSLLWHYAYKGKIKEKDIVDFYCKLVNEIWQWNSNVNIIMLPQLFANGWNDDILLFRTIAEELDDKRIIIIPDCYSSDIQQMIIKDAICLIGARYHSIVFAINQNVPFIALSYEHKIAGMLETLNYTESMIDFRETLFSIVNQEKCLAEIRRLLPLMECPTKAHYSAKQIAYNGMKELGRLL